MTKFQQIERIHQLFSTRRRKLSLETISADLKIEPADTTALIEQMRAYLDAPIEQCPENHDYGYCEARGRDYQLPSFWLNPDEFVLTTRLLQLLSETQPGLLHDDLAQLEGPLNRLLRQRKISLYQFERRVQYQSDEPPYCLQPQLCQLVQGLIDRRQLAITYQDPNDGAVCMNICPQMLSYRAGSWKLAAWCHRQHQLRCFDVARIENAEILTDRSREMAAKNIEKFFANQFGYNQQQPLQLQLKFWGDSAYRVAQQCWHPEQQGHWQEGTFYLSLPLIDQDLLIARLLPHLPDVQVLSPQPFVERFNNLLNKATARQQTPIEIPNQSESIPSVSESEDDSPVQAQGGAA